MGRIILLITVVGLVSWSPSNAKCPKNCKCPSTSTVVECNDFQIDSFGMHVFNLKIVDPAGPVILKNQMFNITGLEFVNTISIENATILEIQESAFKEIPLLSTLEITNCNISSVTNILALSQASKLRTLKISNSTLNVFEYVKSDYLEEIVLTGNNLERITNHTFSGLPSLSLINISDNNISWIDSEAFSNLPYLQEVSFANNNLRDLAPDLFKSNVELVTLDFSNNPLKKFNVNITADLEKLELRSCELKEISQNLSINLDYLSYLDLSNNKIDFTATAFNSMKELDNINLANNSLTTLDSFIFKTNYKLQKIILDNNNFTVLPKLLCSSGSFETYHFSCRKCNISKLFIDTFKQFPALVSLSLSNNHITSSHLSAFNHLRSLIELDLSYNSIESLTSDIFSKSTSLEKLNMANNPIKDINPLIFENNRVLKTLDLSYCSLERLWIQPSKNALGSLRQLILNNNNITTITTSDLAVIGSIEVLDITNNPLQCDQNLTNMIVWLNKHEVSPVQFKTHEEMHIVNSVDSDVFSTHWNWKQLANSTCPKSYYVENFESKQYEPEIIKKIIKSFDDSDYHFDDFDSDEDQISASDESAETEQFGKDIIGGKVEKISPSQNKDQVHYSFLWPTLVFIFTSLSVLVIAANIMLLMLRSTAARRHIQVPHIKIPQWNSGTKLKKHSGSVYQPLSEEKYDSCISIPEKHEHVPTHRNT